MLSYQSGSFCSHNNCEDIIFLFLGFKVRDLDAPQTCKKEQLERDWQLLSVCHTLLLLFSASSPRQSVSQGWLV